MGVWMAPTLEMRRQWRAPCDEDALLRDARALLASRFDVEIGAVAPGSPEQTGFQYMKTTDALLAAQAIAHGDFTQAAAQFRRILSYQRHEGGLPFIVYGPSVNASQRWIESPKTFYPGPAFWERSDAPRASVNRSDPMVRLPTATILAPPIAADVAWHMYRLSPYETAMGVVGHSVEAVQFLCDVYSPLKQLHKQLFHPSRLTSSSSLLSVKHPWETMSPFSTHWADHLKRVKSMDGYDEFVRTIPESSKARFASGVVLHDKATSAVEDVLEPMLFLASCYNASLIPSEDPCTLDVHDVEFNTLALRSADALVSIGQVLLDRSSLCTDFHMKENELVAEVQVLDAQATALRSSIVGNATLSSQLWNSSTKLFNDDADGKISNGTPSLRNILPAYSVRLKEEQMMGVLSHIIPASSSVQFFCSQFPASFTACNRSASKGSVTHLLYNYYLQLAFSMNDFPGVGVYIRNSTREMVCRNGKEIPVSFNASSGAPIALFDDGFTGSSLASALLVNILLPSATHPIAPDTPPVDHRMLTVVMCIELVVAFGVALSCVFLSVYFVANRPREDRLAASSPTGRSRKRRGTRSHRSDDDELGRYFSTSNASESSFGSAMDLEEGLLSEEEETAYGSFNRGPRNPAEAQSGSWAYAKEVLASISPW